MQLEIKAEDLASEIAKHLAPTIRALQGGSEGAQGWLTTKEAATYLGVTPNALYKLKGSGAIACSQSEMGASMYFRQADLDEYRERSLTMPR